MSVYVLICVNILKFAWEYWGNPRKLQDYRCLCRV